MTEVTLLRYDISGGNGWMWGQMLGMKMEAVWHTSIVIFGTEYFFDGGCGIAEMIPRTTPFGQPLREESLGKTSKTREEFNRWNDEMRASRFGSTKYELTTNNCNHYTNEAAVFLTGSGCPDDVINMIPNMMESPVGQLLTPIAQMAEQSGLLEMMSQMSQFVPKQLPKRDHRARSSGPGGAGANSGGGPRVVELHSSDEDNNESSEEASAAPAGSGIIPPRHHNSSTRGSEYEEVFPLAETPKQNDDNVSGELDRIVAKLRSSLADASIAAQRSLSKAFHELLGAAHSVLSAKNVLERRILTVTFMHVAALRELGEDGEHLLACFGLHRAANGAACYQLHHAPANDAVAQMYATLQDAAEQLDTDIAIAESLVQSA